MKIFNFSIWGGPRVRKGTLIPARTYTDGQIFHDNDANTDFPHEHTKTREKDIHYLRTHGITDTCPTMKIYTTSERLRVNVNDQSKNNVKLMVSCHCKYPSKIFQ